MATSFDVAANGNITTGTVCTVALTPSAQAGSVVYVVVSVGTGGGHVDTGYTCTATWNGSAMTSVGKIHPNNSNNGTIELFWIANGTADGSSHNAVVTCATTMTGGLDILIATVLSFYGASQSTPTAGTAAGSASPTISRSSATGDQVVFGFASGAAIAGGATQTERSNVTGNAFSSAGNQETQTAAGATSVSAAYTDNADWWGAVASNVAAGAAGQDWPVATTELIGITDSAVVLLPEYRISYAYKIRVD